MKRARTLALVALDLAGVLSILAAGFLVWVPLGLALTGAACFGLAWLVDRPEDDSKG